MPHLIRSRYDQGLAAYRAGHGIAHMIEVAEEIDRRGEELSDAIGHQSQTPDAEVRNRIGDERDALRAGEFGHDAMPSLIAGFADGVLADIRDIRAFTQARRGQTA